MDLGSYLFLQEQIKDIIINKNFLMRPPAATVIRDFKRNHGWAAAVEPSACLFHNPHAKESASTSLDHPCTSRWTCQREVPFLSKVLITPTSHPLSTLCAMYLSYCSTVLHANTQIKFRKCKYKFSPTHIHGTHCDTHTHTHTQTPTQKHMHTTHSGSWCQCLEAHPPHHSCVCLIIPDNIERSNLILLKWWCLLFVRAETNRSRDPYILLFYWSHLWL